MGKPEGFVEKYLRKRVNEAGGLCWKFVCPAVNGVPDRIVVLNGHTLFVETKASGETLEPHQRHRFGQIARAGGEAVAIDSREAVDALVHRLLATKAEPQLTLV